jgi:hypothetical protein
MTKQLLVLLAIKAVVGTLGYVLYKLETRRRLKCGTYSIYITTSEGTCMRGLLVVNKTNHVVQLRHRCYEAQGNGFIVDPDQVLQTWRLSCQS